MPSYMEIIFIDSDGDARQTNMRLALDSDRETWAHFNKCRTHGVGIKQATFLLDYHRGNNDLSDTIAIDNAGFTAITGRAPKTDAEYRQIDGEFWDAVQKAA